MHGFDIKLINYLRKNLYVLAYALLTGIALLIRISDLEFQSLDYRNFLGPWMQELEQAGIRGVGCVGDYNVPYTIVLAVIAYLPFDKLTMVKLVSILFDFVGAAGAAMIVFYLLPEQKRKTGAFICYGAMLLIPAFILNSSYWAQCDSIYVSILLFSILAFMKERYRRSFILLAAAYCLKQQTVFILPAFAVYYMICKKYSILNFLWIPAMYIGSVMPAILMGNSPFHVLSIYMRQVFYYRELTLGYPNLYALIPGDYGSFAGFAFFLAVGILFAGAVVWVIRKQSFKAAEFLELVIWCGMVCVLFLPAMHERYGYIIEAAAIIYAVIDHRKWWLAAALNLTALIAYSPYLFQEVIIDIKYMAIVNIVIFLIYTITIFRGREYELSGISQHRCGDQEDNKSGQPDGKDN